MPIEYLFILLVASLIECSVAFLVGYRTLRYQQAILLVNLFTIPPVSYATWIELIDTIPSYTAAIVLSTVLEVVVLLYVLRTRQVRFILTIILMNVATFAASLVYTLLT